MPDNVPLTPAEFERQAVQAARNSVQPTFDNYTVNEAAFLTALRPLLLRLLAAERERILAALPGGDICDPQQIADTIRRMGDPT